MLGDRDDLLLLAASSRSRRSGSCAWTRSSELFTGVYQAGRWPVSIYPDWLRIGLTFLVPIAFAVTVPAQAFTGRLTPEILGLAALFAVGLLVVTRLALADRPAPLLRRVGVTSSAACAATATVYVVVMR